jgi:DNA repair exonuclease SbcCD nuclease subunit
MTKPYALLADLHLHRWHAFATDLPNGMNSRLQGLLDEIWRAGEEVKIAGGNTLVFAGDVFHVRGSVAPSVLNPVNDLLHKMHLELGTKFVVLPGNHDLEGKETTRLGSAVTAMQRDWVRVINDTQYVSELGAHLIPWHEKTSDLKATLEGIPEPERADAIIHAPIDGVIAGLPLHGLDPVYLASLGYRLIFSGHYHNHKVFDGGVVSIGALAHHTWSDINSRAGFLIVQDGQFIWRKSRLPEFVDLTKLASYDPDDIPGLVDQNFVRVRVEATKSKEVEEARQELLDMGARAVLVEAMPKASAAATRVGATVKSGASLEQSVKDFVTAVPGLTPAQANAVATEAMSVLGSVLTLD